MSLLTLDVGGLGLVVRVQSAGHAEPREVGTRVYTFFGGERSMIRAELMVVAVVLWRLTPADAKAIRDLFAFGAAAPCAGDVFNNAGATVTCSGEITDEARPGLFFAGAPWTIALTLTEVSNAGTASGL